MTDITTKPPHLCLVVDASVGVKWLNEKSEQGVEVARTIAARAKGDEIVLIVPDIFLYEIGNVLVNDRGLTNNDIEERLDFLSEFALQIVHIDQSLLIAITRLARAHQVTFYDAAYLAIAEMYRADLVTEDKDLLHTGLPYVKSLMRYP
ncbi:MAG: type II toxin-antitoxin system VapC family toxin [Patescibacteria group bacterium]